MPLGQLHGERVISMFNSFQLNADFREAKVDDTFSRFVESSKSKFYAQVGEPGDRR